MPFHPGRGLRSATSHLFPEAAVKRAYNRQRPELAAVTVYSALKRR